MDDYADSVEEAVKDMEESLVEFKKESVFYRCLFSKEKAKNAWENLRKKCQQLSGWIEHGRGVTKEMKPELVEKLRAAEKVLLENRRFSRVKL